MATLSNITVTKELRLCKIDKELGYFHCWEQYGDIIFPGIMVGSNPVWYRRKSDRTGVCCHCNG